MVVVAHRTLSLDSSASHSINVRTSSERPAWWTPTPRGLPKQYPSHRRSRTLRIRSPVECQACIRLCRKPDSCYRHRIYAHNVKLQIFYKYRKVYVSYIISGYQPNHGRFAVPRLCVRRCLALYTVFRCFSSRGMRLGFRSMSCISLSIASFSEIRPPATISSSTQRMPCTAISFCSAIRRPR